AAAAAAGPVERARGRDLEALHAAGEREPICGLADQLEPAGPDLERDDPEVGPGERERDRAADRAVRLPAGARARAGVKPSGDPHGVVERQRRANAMRLARNRPARGAAGAGALAAPAAQHVASYRTRIHIANMNAPRSPHRQVSVAPSWQVTPGSLGWA